MALEVEQAAEIDADKLPLPDMSWGELPFTPPDLRNPIEITYTRATPGSRRVMVRSGDMELSLRQLGMLTLKAYGFTNPEVAERFVISLKTVNFHLSQLLDAVPKINGHRPNISEVCVHCARMGLVDEGVLPSIKDNYQLPRMSAGLLDKILRGYPWERVSQPKDLFLEELGEEDIGIELDEHAGSGSLTEKTADGDIHEELVSSLEVVPGDNGHGEVLIPKVEFDERELNVLRNWTLIKLEDLYLTLSHPSERNLSITLVRGHPSGFVVRTVLERYNRISSKPIVFDPDHLEVVKVREFRKAILEVLDHMQSNDVDTLADFR